MNNNTRKESESGSFIKFPKKLIKDPRYKGISYGAKLLYAMLCDRRNLSEVNNWYDDNGQVYIYYSVASIAEDMGCCINTARKFMKELENLNMITKYRQGMGLPDKLYIKDYTGSKSEQQKCKKCNSKDAKNELHEVQNLHPNKTEYSKTEINKTDINNTYSEDVCVVMKYLNDKTYKNYKLTQKTRTLIESRFREGYTKEDFIHVIDVKYNEWYGTDKEKYIRPSTLFGDDNFDNYVNQRESESIKKGGKTRLEDEHDYDVEMLERALFGE